MAATRRSDTVLRAIRLYPSYPAYPPFPPPVYGWQPGYPPPPGYGNPPPAVVRRAVDAGNHPVAAVEPERHLQRRRRLHSGQPESSAGLDGHRRGDHAAHFAGRVRRTTGRGQPAAGRRPPTSSPELMSGPGCCRAGSAGLVGWLAGIVLTGMLTVVVGRAVFGGHIGAGESWDLIRGRLPALLGLVGSRPPDWSCSPAGWG